MNKVVRSKAYPSLDLQAAVKKVESMARNLGKGSFTREEITLAMGYKGVSGASARAVAALVHYGLLDRRKDEYVLSDLGHAIAYPTDPEAKSNAIKKAVLKPAIIKEITEQYSGQSLPDKQFLANILTGERYGINPRQKDEVASIIISSLEFAGDLDPMALSDNDSNETTDERPSLESHTQNFSDSLPARSVSSIDQAQDDLNRIEIVLREGVKAGIYAPFNLTDPEKEKLKAIIDLL